MSPTKRTAQTTATARRRRSTRSSCRPFWEGGGRSDTGLQRCQDEPGGEAATVRRGAPPPSTGPVPPCVQVGGVVPQGAAVTCVPLALPVPLLPLGRRLLLPVQDGPHRGGVPLGPPRPVGTPSAFSPLAMPGRLAPSTRSRLILATTSSDSVGWPATRSPRSRFTASPSLVLCRSRSRSNSATPANVAHIRPPGVVMPSGGSSTMSAQPFSCARAASVRKSSVHRASRSSLPRRAHPPRRLAQRHRLLQGGRAALLPLSVFSSVVTTDHPRSAQAASMAARWSSSERAGDPWTVARRRRSGFPWSSSCPPRGPHPGAARAGGTATWWRPRRMGHGRTGRSCPPGEKRRARRRSAASCQALPPGQPSSLWKCSSPPPGPGS